MTMAMQVVTVPNLGNEFDVGVEEAGKLHIKLGAGLTRDPATGMIAATGVDVHVQGVAWDSLTNELTLTQSDGSTHVVSLATLAADKFLAGSSFDPATNELTLTMTDGSTYVIALADLVTVAVDVGLAGSGTTANPLVFDAQSIPQAAYGTQQTIDRFVMSTSDRLEGQLVPVENAALLVYETVTPQIETQIDGRLTDVLTVDVQDAFGNHLYFAMP
jgi:hypothetical protein